MKRMLLPRSLEKLKGLFLKGFVLERDRIISSLTLGGSSDFVVEEILIEVSLPTKRRSCHC